MNMAIIVPPEISREDAPQWKVDAIAGKFYDSLEAMFIEIAHQMAYGGISIPCTIKIRLEQDHLDYSFVAEIEKTHD